MLYYLTWLFVIVLYAPMFNQLYRYRWEHIDYTHAYFILPVSLWLTWRKREVLKDLFAKAAPVRSGHAGMVAMAIGLTMFVFGWRLDYLFISALSLIPVLWGVTFYLYGGAVVKSLMFPILYLLCLVPPPLGILDAVTMPMRYGVSEATEAILQMLNYPITRSGLMLTTGGNEIFMGAPCSGFRSLITMFTLAAVYVYLARGGMGKKLVLVSSVIPFALLGNLIRVITLCLITFYAGKEAAEGFFHYFSGALIFLIMIASLMGLEYILDRPRSMASEA